MVDFQNNLNDKTQIRLSWKSIRHPEKDIIFFIYRKEQLIFQVH